MKEEPIETYFGFSLKRLLENESQSVSRKRKKVISLSKSRSSSASSSQQTQPSTPKLETIDIKSEIPKKESFIEETKVKLEAVDIQSDIPKKEVFKEECKIKLEPTAISLSDYDDDDDADAIPNSTEKSSTVLEEYTCPICNQDLTHVKSSYLRQQHVEGCLASNDKPEPEELEFDDCVFCGKNLTHFNSSRRQVHINTCLDTLDDLERQKQESSYAGQHVPFLSTLDLCPVCHEFEPLKGRALKQKIMHIKQCSKRHQLSTSQLLKKFQWIGWGHAPLPSKRAESKPASPVPSVSSSPHHQVVAYAQDFNTDDQMDDDFSRQVIFHKTRIAPSSKRDDLQDEELQTALAISKSMQTTKKKQQRITPLDEEKWNSANVYSSEESKQRAIAKLDEILFSVSEADKCIQAQREMSVGILGASRIPAHGHFFWNLASNKESNWEDPTVFMSVFIRNLYE